MASSTPTNISKLSTVPDDVVTNVNRDEAVPSGSEWSKRNRTTVTDSNYDRTTSNTDKEPQCAPNVTAPQLWQPGEQLVSFIAARPGAARINDIHTHAGPRYK
jgi:hypothetical protein